MPHNSASGPLTPEQLQVIRRLSAELRDFRSDTIPKRLYHYTTGTGLIGILNTGRLRATNFAYLNDSHELRYGLDLAISVVDAALARVDGEESKPLKMTRGILERIGIDIHYYIASFCAESDLLSQWRAYGAHGSRYSIGFDPGELVLSVGTQLHRAIYQRAEQEDYVAKAISAAICVYRAQENKQPGFANRVAGVLAAGIIGLACSFKHQGFREECEWRLVHEVLSNDNEQVQFDTTPQGLIRPFVELTLTNRADPKGALPICDLIIGSSPLPANTLVHSTGVLLSRYGYTGVLVRPSDIPLRA